MIVPKTFFVIFCIIILPDELQSIPEVDWFDSVNTRLCDSQNVHTAVIIHHHNASDSDAVKDKLFGRIIGSMSSVIVEIDEGGIELKELDFGAVSKSSTSLLFIFYAEYSGDNEEIYRGMGSINKLADFAVNYLLIILRTSEKLDSGIEDISRNAWKKSILNIMIVEINSEKNFHRFSKVFDKSNLPNSKEKVFNKGRNKIHNSDPSQVIVHQFNPFIKKFYHNKFSPELELFPNFAKNMHEHDLNVALLHRPPFASVKWYENNTIKEMSGPNIVLLRTLAEKLNFNPIYRARTNEGDFWRSDFTFEDLNKFIEKSKIDIFAHLGSRYTKNVMENTLKSRTIMIQEMGVLMPKNYKINQRRIDNALYSSALTVVIIIIIWFAVILLKFDKRFWKLTIIFSLIFSIPVHRQPSKNYERILFFFVVMLGFIYSNDIYASLTNFDVDPFVEDEFSTLEEIDDSGLTPIMISGLFRKTFRENAVGAERTLKNRTLREMDIAYCPKMAAVHHNVCCIMSKTEAEYYKKSNQDKLKFAKPILKTNHAAFGFRQGLPCRTNINEFIDRFNEVGLLSRWYSHCSSSTRRKVTANDKVHLGHDHRTSQGQQRNVLIVVTIFGHSIAALVFIAEVLIHRYKNSLKKKSRVHPFRPCKTKIGRKIR